MIVCKRVCVSVRAVHTCIIPSSKAEKFMFKTEAMGMLIVKYF